MRRAFLVLQSGEIFEGQMCAGENRAGEVVFNTSHSGYEEIATDPSYFSQIFVATAPMQGNYGVSKDVWESRQLWIEGFVSLEVQNSPRDSGWVELLNGDGIPIITGLDTRKLVLTLRDKGTTWGALVAADSQETACHEALALIEKKQQEPADWVRAVSRTRIEDLQGEESQGPRVAVIDFGCKENILRILKRKSSQIRVFPCFTGEAEIRDWEPQGILLSNGPGDPAHVDRGVLEAVRKLVGWRPLLGICMGHQILAQVLGAKTFKLKFGHRGGNHPVKDLRSGEIYMTSQNHGYAVEPESLPKDVIVTHTNLNDRTVEGIEHSQMKCKGIQFHPESHPGPRDPENLINSFLSQLK